MADLFGLDRAVHFDLYGSGILLRDVIVRELTLWLQRGPHAQPVPEAVPGHDEYFLCLHISLCNAHVRHCHLEALLWVVDNLKDWSLD